MVRVHGVPEVMRNIFKILDILTPGDRNILKNVGPLTLDYRL
jgi:hypothetical protein